MWKILVTSLLLLLSVSPSIGQTRFQQTKVDSMKLDRIVSKTEQWLKNMPPAKKASFQRQMRSLQFSRQSKQARAKVVQNLFRSHPEFRHIVEAEMPSASALEKNDVTILIGLKIKF